MISSRTFRRLLTYMSRYKLLYTTLIITMVVGTSVDLSVAWFLSLVTNAAVKQQSGDWPNLILIGGGILAVAALNNYFDAYFKQKASLSVRSDIRRDTMSHLLRLPQSFFDRHHSGDLLARMTTDNQALGEACGPIMMALLKNPLLALSALAYLLSINWPLALITLSIGPLMLLVSKLFGQIMRKSGMRHQEVMGRATSFLQDALGASMLFKIFGLEKKLAEKYRLHSDSITAIERAQGKVQGTANAVSSAIASLNFMIAIVVAGFFVAKGNLEVGAMLAFIQLMNYLVQPFSSLPGLWSGMQQALAGADRIFQVMDAAKEYDKLPEVGRAKTSFRELRISGVGFSYAEGEEGLALRDVSFNVVAGQTIAIVGASGGGKSTLFKLLMGLYTLTEGSILVDGQSIESLGLRNYRAYFSLVPQETVLFTGTIRDNIMDGNPDADEASVLAAAKQANAYDFIMQLSEDFNTEIGERGSRLSGGQKQRIAIARAILRDAPILLLDEATSALDNEAERIVQDALAKLKAGRTTIMIAHRLTTVQHTDKILVMENGMLVEQGTHSELLQAGGRYHALYNAQMSKVLGEALEV